MGFNGRQIINMPGGAHMSRAGPVLGGNSCWTSKSIFMAHMGRAGEDCRVDTVTTDARWGREFCLFSKASRPSFGPTQPPKQWVPADYALGLKRPECKITFHVHLVQNYELVVM